MLRDELGQTLRHDVRRKVQGTGSNGLLRLILDTLQLPGETTGTRDVKRSGALNLLQLKTARSGAHRNPRQSLQLPGFF